MERPNYEHKCRMVLEYIFLLINNNNVNIPKYDIDINKEFYTTDELIYITSYDKNNYYFPPKRPAFLKLNKLSIDEKNEIINDLNEDVDIEDELYLTLNDFDSDYPLEIDCYNENLKLGLEVDSKSHSIYDYTINKSYHDFCLLKKHDMIKDYLCKKNNITLLRIDYLIYQVSIDNIKLYLYNELKNINYNFNYLNKDSFLNNTDDINLHNKIYNNYGEKNGYKLINILERLHNLNYIYSKYVLHIEDQKALFLVTCNKNHEYISSYKKIYRGRKCPQCATNAPVTNDIINDIITIHGLSIISKYNNMSNTNQTFKCDDLGHTFTSSWDNMKQRCKMGCRVCNNLRYTIPIYQYELKTKQFIKKYENIDEVIKLNNDYIKMGIIYNCMNDLKYKSAHNYKWSFLPPTDNKFDPEVKLNDKDKMIMRKISIGPEPIKGKNRKLTDDDKRITNKKKVYEYNMKTYKEIIYVNAADVEIKKDYTRGNITRVINKYLNPVYKDHIYSHKKLSIQDINKIIDIDENFPQVKDRIIQKPSSTNKSRGKIVYEYDINTLEETKYLTLKSAEEARKLTKGDISTCINKNNVPILNNYIYSYEPLSKDDINKIKNKTVQQTTRSKKVYEYNINTYEELIYSSPAKLEKEKNYNSGIIKNVINKYKNKRYKDYIYSYDKLSKNDIDNLKNNTKQTTIKTTKKENYNVYEYDINDFTEKQYNSPVDVEKIRNYNPGNISRVINRYLLPIFNDYIYSYDRLSKDELDNIIKKKNTKKVKIKTVYEYEIKTNIEKIYNNPKECEIFRDLTAGNISRCINKYVIPKIGNYIYSYNKLSINELNEINKKIK